MNKLTDQTFVSIGLVITIIAVSVWISRAFENHEVRITTLESKVEKQGQRGLENSTRLTILESGCKK